MSSQDFNCDFNVLGEGEEIGSHAECATKDSEEKMGKFLQDVHHKVRISLKNSDII